MSMTRRNLLVGTVGLACSGMALAAARGNEAEPLADDALDRVVPKRFSGWSSVPTGEVVLPSQNDLTNEVYNDVLVRVYQNAAGNSVAFLMAYGSLQSRDMQLHRPEVCYPAAGFNIQSAETLELRLPGQPPIGARLLGTASQARPEQVLYWTRIGTEFPTTQLAQRWAVVRHNLRGEMPDGILVRMSTVSDDAKSAFPILHTFISDLMRAAPPGAQRFLVGQA